MKGKTLSAPSFKKLKPSSESASLAAKRVSKKSDTKPELFLRSALWKAGLRYRKNVNHLSGKPDIVFLKDRVVIFCDGDFWHGKNWQDRKLKLKRGSNSDYWTAKIKMNIERDKIITRKLKDEGWTVLRFWESDINNDIKGVVSIIMQVINEKDNMSNLI